MSFQIKDFASIAAAEINHARAVTDKITDWAPGSVARTLIEAPAVEIEELYLQMFLGLRDAIPVATFLSFGFDRLPAMRAHGFASVSITPAPVDPIEIPEGTLFATDDGRNYLSTEAVTWAAGQPLVRVPIACTVAGLVGNLAPGVITSSSLFDVGNGYVISNAAITTGRDPENDAEREARFSDFIQSISRGTVVACRYAARQARVFDADGNIYEYVTRSGIDETPGRVSIYIYSSRGEASPELIAAAQLLLDGTRDDEAGTITPGYRSAGVRVDILPMLERAVPFSIQVAMLDGYSLTTAVEQDLQDVFATVLSSVGPGQTLYIGSMIEALLAVPGVLRVVPQSTENIFCEIDEALIPGTFTVTAL